MHNTYVSICELIISVRDTEDKRRKSNIPQKYYWQYEEQPQTLNLSLAFGLFVHLRHLSNFVWKRLCVEKGRVLYCNYVRQAYNNYNNYQLSANNTLRTPPSIKITLVSNRYLKLSSFKLKGYRFGIFYFLIKDSNKNPLFHGRNFCLQ